MSLGLDFTAADEVETALAPAFVGLIVINPAEEIGSGFEPLFYPSSTLIQVRRGLDANLPGSFLLGEPAFTTDSFRVFFGTGSGKVEIPVFSANGYILLTKTAAPADGELAASQVTLWFDATNGAAKLKIKGKSANGTVVAGEVALA